MSARLVPTGSHSWMVSLLRSLPFYTPAEWSSKLITWCDLKRKVICYQLELGNALPMFWLNAPVVVRLKVKTCEQTGTHSLSPWWQLQHSVETSTKSFLPKLSWYQITFLFRSQHVACFTGPPFCKWQTLGWEDPGMNFTVFLSARSSSYLSLQSLYQPPMSGRPNVCEQWEVWCILRLQITRRVFTGQGSDGVWQRWKDLPEPVPPRSNCMQQWNKYILQARWKLPRYEFYPGEVRSSHWISILGNHFISVVIMIDFVHSDTATSRNHDHYCGCVYKLWLVGAMQVSHQKVV